MFRVHTPRPIAIAWSAAASLLCACASPGGNANVSAGGLVHPLAIQSSFVAPEAVRYDPEQDVYFVANWGGNGDPNVRDNNGFISRMNPDGSVATMRFVAGGSGGVTLHAPRGMYIVGDTLWVADQDAVRGFDRHSGAVLASVDFSGLDRGFLNDVAADADGAIYVTDTGRNKLYRVRGGPSLVLSDTTLGAPNGIAWDAAHRRFLILPFNGGHTLHAWASGTSVLINAGTSPTGAKFDGIELLSGGRLLVSSQADSSLHLFEGGRGRPIIHVGGPPADIGVDTKRNRVAVPIVSMNRVEIYQLP